MRRGNINNPVANLADLLLLVVTCTLTGLFIGIVIGAALAKVFLTQSL